MIHDLYLDQRADLAAEAVVLRRLWRAVLVQALREAKGNIVNTGNESMGEVLDRNSRWQK
jgi:hypothetical protein